MCSWLVDTPGVGYTFWGVQVGPGGVELPPGRSEEVQGSLEPHNGGLRALEEAWMTTFA